MAGLGLRDRVKGATKKGTGEPFEILFVCTGNICRSPVAEQLFIRGIAAVGASAQIRVSSAGTAPNPGQEMPEQAKEIARSFGSDPEEHRARRVTEEQIDRADIVFALAREHRSSIARLRPRAIGKTFTLLEFARLLQVVASETVTPMRPPLAEVADTLREIVDRVSAHRGVGGHGNDPEADDVKDPYKRSQQTYDLSAAQIFGAGRSIVSSLRQINGDTSIESDAASSGGTSFGRGRSTNK